MNAETDFHKRRKAFVIINNAGILMAQDGFSGSHFDLLRAAGFGEEQSRLMIEIHPRGYALDGNVYFYQGADFCMLSADNEQVAKSYVSFFEKQGLLTQKAFNGMKQGEIGQSWIPIGEL